jgi:hypothetical protein
MKQTKTCGYSRSSPKRQSSLPAAVTGSRMDLLCNDEIQPIPTLSSTSTTQFTSHNFVTHTHKKLPPVQLLLLSPCFGCFYFDFCRGQFLFHLCYHLGCNWFNHWRLSIHSFIIFQMTRFQFDLFFFDGCHFVGNKHFVTYKCMHVEIRKCSMASEHVFSKTTPPTTSTTYIRTIMTRRGI